MNILEIGGKPPAKPPAAPPTVLKLGGSVLTDESAYRRCAAALRRRLDESPEEKLIVVTSARLGLTDELEQRARALDSAPPKRALDLLWSTGEMQSVALLTMCLHAIGVDAVGLNVHETGLCVAATQESEPPRLRLQPGILARESARHDVVVVPGFFACAAAGAVTSLGRGGSDLSAVLLAAWLPAARCELIKDVPGYFDRDPHRYPDARPLSRLSYARALRMAADGCDLVQLAAVEAAARTKTTLVVRDLEDDATSTCIDDREDEVEGITAACERAFRTIGGRENAVRRT